MKKIHRKSFYWGAGMLAAFVLWTVALRVVDVQAIGPLNSSVGFSSLNNCIHKLTGVNMNLYITTDLLEFVPMVIGSGFALLGLLQWIRRKQLRQVDISILALGGFYIAVLAAYILFEHLIINYRPILIDGRLEASYPSSTTLLVICVMSSAAMQLDSRIKTPFYRRCTVLLGAALLLLYYSVSGLGTGQR